MLDTKAFDQSLKVLYAEKWQAETDQLVQQANSPLPFVREYARRVLGLYLKTCKQCAQLFYFKHGNQRYCPKCRSHKRAKPLEDT